MYFCNTHSPWQPQPRTLRRLLATTALLASLGTVPAAHAQQEEHDRAADVFVAQSCAVPEIKAVHPGLHDLTVVFQTPCTLTTATQIFYTKAGGQQTVSVSPAYEAGDRMRVLGDLLTGTQYCVTVRTWQLFNFADSAPVCTSTKWFPSALGSRAPTLSGVGAVSTSPFASLGHMFTPTASKVYKITAKQGGSCRGVVIRDASGNYVDSSSGCNVVSVFLLANQRYYLYATDGESQENATATCDLTIDNVGSFTGVPCGWRTIGFAQLQSAERLQGVHLPPQNFLPPSSFTQWQPPTMRMVVLPGKGVTSLKNSVGNFIAKGAEQVIPTTGYTEALVLVGYATNTSVSIPVRIVRNDVALGDRDGDGLGNALEANIGLCDDPAVTRSGFDCARAYDQRDTDGDGIRDAWELLGRKKPTNLSGTDQPLPYWGANPRHKDLFWEIDYTPKTWQDPAMLKLDPQAARYAHAAYSFSGNATLAVVTDSERQRDNAADLENPDGKPGIALHVDNGIFPEHLSDWTIFGDWGGYTANDLTFCGITLDGEPFCHYPEWGDIWDTAMPEVRYGIFKWGLGYPSTGGRGSWGMGFGIGLAADSVRQAEVLLHEGGHTMGLDHSGPFQLDASGARPNYDPENGGFNCEPFYMSIMNYRYEGRFNHAIDYDLQEPHTFADSHVINHRAVNNTRLIERDAVDYYMANPVPSVRDFIMDMLRDMKYPVSTDGDVDWNRDGVIADVPVAAGSNRLFGGCDEARANQTAFGGRWFAPKSLAVASFNGTIQVVGVDAENTGWWGGVRFDAACRNFDADACTTMFPAQSTQFPTARVPLFSIVSGVDIAVVQTSTSTRQAVAVGLMAGQSTIQFAHTTQEVPSSSGASQWTNVRTFTARHVASGDHITLMGEPEIVAIPASPVPGLSVPAIAWLFVNDTNHQVYMAALGLGASGWSMSAFHPVLYTSDSDISTALVLNNPVSSASGLHMYDYATPPSEIVPGVTLQKVHLFVPQGNAVMVLQQTDGFAFIEAGRINTGTILPGSKVAPAFVTRFQGNANYGQLYLYYAGANGRLEFARAMARPLANDPLNIDYVVEKFGQIDHNGVVGAFVAVANMPGVDEQARLFWALRALNDTGVPVSGLHGLVNMRPRPDNIYDKDMWGFNDWLTLKHTMCYQVSRGGDHTRSRVEELGDTPISCRPIPQRDPTHPGL